MEQLELLHHRINIVDAHLDLAYDLYAKRLDGRTHVIRDEYLEDFKKGGVNLIVSSLFVDSKDLPEGALHQAMGQVGALYAELEETPELTLCRSYAQIEAALAAGQIAVLLSFEGVEPLGSEEELLPVFYELGVRLLGLCWSRRNLAADGALFSDLEQGQKSGLSPFGYRLVKKALALGMLVDVSHLNDEGFEDVMRLTDRPVIASHSNCRALHGTPRNLTDDQIRAIAATGGVIGINGVSSIVAGSCEEATIQKLADHMDHIAQVGGEDCVGLGFDFAEKILAPGASFVVAGNEVRAFDLLRGYAGLPVLTQELLDRGWSEERIAKAYGGNFLRVYRQWL